MNNLEKAFPIVAATNFPGTLPEEQRTSQHEMTCEPIGRDGLGGIPAKVVGFDCKEKTVTLEMDEFPKGKLVVMIGGTWGVIPNVPGELPRNGGTSDA